MLWRVCNGIEEQSWRLAGDEDCLRIGNTYCTLCPMFVKWHNYSKTRGRASVAWDSCIIKTLLVTFVVGMRTRSTLLFNAHPRNVAKLFVLSCCMDDVILFWGKLCLPSAIPS